MDTDDRDGFKDCLCYGSNENCRYCFGTGVIKKYPQVSQLPNEQYHRRNQPSQRRVLKRCPFCRTPIRPDRLTRHMQKVHGHFSPATSEMIGGQTESEPRKATIPSIDREVGQSREPVPLASASVPVSQTKAPRRTPTPEVKVTPKSESTSQIQRTPCPVCQCVVPNDELPGHIQKEHRVGSLVAIGMAKRQITQRSDPLRVNQRVGHLRSGQGGSVDAEDHAAEHFLDYTSRENYAENFRESGRFGSHSSHDDYGEEGEP